MSGNWTPQASRLPEHICLSLPAGLKYLNIVGACVAELIARSEPIDEAAEVTYSVQLAVQEVCANIVEHAYLGTSEGRIEIYLAVEQEPRQILIEIQDTGAEFDPDTVTHPDLDQAQVRGYGLFLAIHVLDDLAYYRVGQSNYWRLVKRL